MCVRLPKAQNPLVGKDKTRRERGYNGLDWDTVNFAMEWGLKTYLLSKGERINKY